MTISVEQLSVMSGGSTRLSDVTTRFERGRVTVLIGPNGAGKTTLLRCLLGLEAAASGRVLIDDRPLAALPRRDRARRLAWLPQSAAPQWNLSARELVGLGRLPWGGGARDAEVDRALAATATTAFADRPIDQLSGGERARVFFARLLAGESDWILADEPLASLDPLHQQETLQLLATAAHDEGKGVIVILHELDAAANIADDIIILKDGRVIGDALEAAQLEAAFGIRFDVIAHGTRRLIVPAA